MTINAVIEVKQWQRVMGLSSSADEKNVFLEAVAFKLDLNDRK